MSDVYFLQVSGGCQKELAETLVEKAKDSNVASGDNLIIVPEEVKPLNRDEAMEYLEQMADALDVEVTDNESG